MNTTKKIIIAALVLILVGAIIFTVTMCRNKWNIPGVLNTNMSTQSYEISEDFFTVTMRRNKWNIPGVLNTNMSTQSYEIPEDFDNISMNVETSAVTFVRSNNSRCTIVITDNENASFNVEVKNRTLNIERLKKSGFFIEFGSPTITVYLPHAEYKDLSIIGSTGSVEIPSTFNFKSIDVEMTTGDISCSAAASDNISLRVSTGEIDLSSTSASEIYLHVSTGKIEAKDIKCAAFSSDGSTGRIELEDALVSGLMKIERSTGDVRLNNCDAYEINIETHTGDISGSLRSEKIFIARSDTGRINVPETLSGGKCKLISVTGDINITIRH